MYALRGVVRKSNAAVFFFVFVNVHLDEGLRPLLACTHCPCILSCWRHACWKVKTPSSCLVRHAYLCVCVCCNVQCWIRCYDSSRRKANTASRLCTVRTCLPMLMTHLTCWMVKTAQSFMIHHVDVLFCHVLAKEWLSPLLTFTRQQCFSCHACWLEYIEDDVRKH